MDLFSQVQSDLLTSIREFAGDVFVDIADKIRFSVPPAHLHTDYSTNAAMVLAKALHQPAPTLAAQLADSFATLPYVAATQVAGAYINLTFTPSCWQAFLQDLLTAGKTYGDGSPRERVLLEFISANPTGPLHIGHTRGAILGLALDRLLTKAGYQVTTEYYINDYGVQIHTLLRSLQFRYQQACGLHQGENVPEGCYPGDYLLPIAETWYKQYDDQYVDLNTEEFYARFKDEAVAAMMDLIRTDVNSLGLTYDNFVSETALVEQGAITQALDVLSQRTATITDDDGHQQTLPCLYHGRLDAPIGRPANEQEQEDSRHDDGEQTIFRSTAYGDDRDRVVARSDGSTTYFASDIAYHYDKIKRGFPVLINLFGADHGGYVARLTGAVSALSAGQTHLEILLMQLVALEKDGQPFKMSKRAGNFVLLRDVLQEVDVDELKLFILTKAATTPMTFDLVRIKQKSKDNPVYYIQYACTRTFSLARRYQQLFGHAYQFDPDDLTILDGNELASLLPLLQALAHYPGVIQLAARERAPYILVTYLYELSGLFHALWSQPRQLLDLANPTHSHLMMALSNAVQTVLVSALDCLAVTPKQEM